MHSILFVFAFASICAMDIRWRQGGGENREREQQCAPNYPPAITYLLLERLLKYIALYKVLKLLRFSYTGWQKLHGSTKSLDLDENFKH